MTRMFNGQHYQTKQNRQKEVTHWSKIYTKTQRQKLKIQEEKKLGELDWDFG